MLISSMGCVHLPCSASCISTQIEITKIFLDFKKDFPHNRLQPKSRADYGSKEENKWATADVVVGSQPTMENLLLAIVRNSHRV
jgi:hypothetical protein